MTMTTKGKAGRHPLPESERRTGYYVFRVTEWERGWLDSVGNGTFWRYFDVTCAKILKGSYKYKQEDVSLEWVVNVAKEIVKVYEEQKET